MTLTLADYLIGFFMLGVFGTLLFDIAALLVRRLGFGALLLCRFSATAALGGWVEALIDLVWDAIIWAVRRVLRWTRARRASIRQDHDRA